MDMLVRHTLIILVSLLGASLPVGLSSENPKILIRNGSLFITPGGKDGNITFQTSEKGFVNWKRGNAKEEGFGGGISIQVPDSSLQRRVQELERILNSNIEQRVQTLENDVQRLKNQHESEGEEDVTGLPQMRVQIRQLQRLMRRLREVLNRDHCAESPCRNGGSCISTVQGPICQCPDNWEGATCEEDVNECSRFAGTDLGCQNGATCQNLPGTYRCHCLPKWYGIHCTQRNDDCSSGTHEEICGHGTCIDTSSGSKGHTCICQQGWTTDGVNSACVVDVNECESSANPCSRDPRVQCLNTPGSFSCQSCPSGYSGNGFYCEDINECLVNNGGCSLSPRVDCHNRRGSFSCGECPPGYQGNGMTCTFLGPCHINNGGCSPMAICLVSSGIVQCFCRPGYNGLGIGPIGCMPGESQYPNLPGPSGGGAPTGPSPCASSPCLHGSACIPMASGFLCNCGPGYTGATCSAEINECDSGPCLNGASCVDMTNAYRCVCDEGFKGHNCEEEVESCGGLYLNEEGSITFPPSPGAVYDHGLNCEFIIETTADKVLNVTFSAIHIEDSHACEFDYVSFRSQNEGGGVFGRFCGDRIPEPFSSPHNSLIMTFHSDHTENGMGFSLSWTSVDPVCGGEIHDQSHGSVYSPGYPANYPPMRDCTWTIFARPSKRVQLHFATIQIEDHPNCIFDYVQVRDGVALGPNTHILGKFCNSTTPRPITSSGSIVSIDFHSDSSANDKGFHITWSEVPGIPGCGGVYTSDAGQFSTPGHPETYESHLECDYIVRAPPSTTLKLSFLDMNIEHHFDCAFDFVEVRDGGREDAPLIGRYCGSIIPSDIYSSGNQLFVRFNSDYDVQYTGFRAAFETVCGGTFNDPAGILMSPNHPNAYHHNKVCDYLIALPVGFNIHVEFIDFDIEDSYFCTYDYLEIRDGDNSNSSSIGTFCGDPSVTPAPFDTTHNYLWLRFATDHSQSNRGFKLNYTSTESICGGIYKDATGIIASPKDTEHYPHDIDCKWIIQGEPGTIIRLNWNEFILEEGSNCVHDYVRVTDDVTRATSPRYCGTSTPPVTTSVSNKVIIQFVADSSFAYEGFSLSYSILNGSKVCGGHYNWEAGTIRSPGWPNNYGHDLTCEWTISVSPGQQIHLNASHFELEDHRECNFDYLEIRNGGYLTSPLIGKYCSNRFPFSIPSSGHELYLKFVSDSSSSAKGFEISWDGTSTGCGGHLISSEGSITSPGYPLPYHHNAECIWNIHISQGSKIQIVFTDFDLENGSGCSFDYVQIIDTSSLTRDLLGRFCNSRPSNIISSGNSVQIKFRTDSSYSKRGFHLHYSTVCDTELNDFDGAIESPNFPYPYPRLLDCTWRIKAPRGNKIQISFPYFRLSPKTVFGSSLACPYDQLNITSLSESGERSNFNSYCGAISPEQYNSTSNTVSVKFRSGNYHRGYYAFRLEYTIVGCGGRIQGRPRGWLRTPQYPHTFSDSMDCIWRISTDLGTRIELVIQELDLGSSQDCAHESLTVYGGPDETSPMLTQQCTRRSGNMTVQTMGNHMLVVFSGDSSGTGKLFMGKFEAKAEGCGGLVSAPHGSIHSPHYPNSYDKDDDCAWAIQTDPGHAVSLSFADFDIMPTVNCSKGFVAVYDGDSTNSPQILRYCNQSVPSPNNFFVSSGNQMYVRLKAGGSVVSKGFLANYSSVCGGHRVLEDGEDGELTSPNFPHAWTQPGNCSWTLEGSRETDRVTLSFLHMDIFDVNGSEESENCTNTRIEVRDGLLIDSPLIAQFCTPQIPPSITSRGNGLHVFLTKVNHLPEGFGFRATYSKENSACGGELTSGRGRIASPQYPDPYPINVECVWTIGGWPGNRISFQLIDFNIEESEGCNKDYLELHEDGPSGRLLGHYCGSNIPSNFTFGKKLWIKFNSDSTLTGNGFVAEFSLLTDNEITNKSSGQVSSPLYPLKYRSLGDEIITWRIIVEEGSKIQLWFDYQDVTIGADNYCLSYILIKDGYDDEASVLYGSCGVWRPRHLTTTGNVAYITFHSDEADQRRGSKFLLSWREVPGISFARLTPFNRSRCFRTLNINSTIRINNTNYPTYSNNEDCTWILESLPDTRIKIVITELLMESSYHCNYDAVTIYDGVHGTQQWRREGRFCKRSHVGRVIYSSGSFMKIVFRTDSSVVRGKGFIIMASPACGGYLTDGHGIISSPLYPHTYPRGLDCTWRVSVRAGTTIQVTFEDLDIHATDSVCSNNDYLEIRNGETNASPFILLNEDQGSSQNGRLCGSNTPAVFNTSSNHLSVSFKTAPGHGSSGAGFKLNYRMLSLTCGDLFSMTSKEDEYVFNSPNYPNAPSSQVECTWGVVSLPGMRLQLDFLENFDIKPSRLCTKEGVQVFDGLSEDSLLLGTFCHSKPATLFASSYMIYLRYYTFNSSPNGGFKAKIKIATCGGTHFLGSQYLTLSSPEYPHSYANNLDCQWNIIASKGHSMTITFVDLDIASFRNCTQGDYLSIVDHERSFEPMSLGTFCGRGPIMPVMTLGNNITISFKTKALHHRRKGFLLRVNSSVSTCGGELTGTSGVLTSPGYPNGIPSFKRCNWDIKAPKGHVISFRFEDIDLNNDCEKTNIVVYFFYSRTLFYPFNDFDPSYICHRDPPSPDKTFKSPVNNLFVGYQTNEMLGHRGFKMTWNSSAMESGCGGDIGSSGIISPVMDPSSGNYTIPQFCHWTHISESLNSTILYKANNVQIRPSNNSFCNGDYLIFHSSTTKPRGMEACGQRSIEFITSEKKSRFSFVSSNVPTMSNVSSKGFNMTYETFPCGGVLSSAEHTITSPGFDSGGYPSDMDCVWGLHFEEGEQIAIDFNAFDLQSSPDNCNNGDYLQIVNGPIHDKYPDLWKGCGVDLPGRRLVSMRSDLWIRFHSNGDSINGRGFSLTAVPLSNGCGGQLHETKGTISLPKEGTSKYENGMECIWEIELMPGLDVRINFTDRFEVETSAGCNKDYLQMEHWNEETLSWTQVGDKLCGREIPPPILLPYHRTRVIFRSDNDINGDGFKVKWSLSCGGNFTEDEGEISSPGYPIEYGVDIDCTYNIAASPTDHILIKFQEPFEIEDAEGCEYDALTVVKTLKNAQIGRYCGVTPPSPISAQGPLSINFHSDYVVVKGGFRFTYEVHRCGGNISTEGTELFSPLSPTKYKSNSNCTWFIVAPENQVVEVKFNFLDLEASGNCRYDRVSVYDGHTLNETKELGRLCGNQSRIPIIKSTKNEMTIQFISDVSFSAAGFKAVVKFTYGNEAGCGGMINMTAGSSKTIKSVDADGDGNYEMDLNCQWTVFAARDKIIKLTFNSFDIESEENATYTRCWDYIKIFDGPGQFSPLIGEFCGSNIPSMVIQSSRNFLWINFFSDSTNVRGGFEAVLSVEDPPCGSHTVINATNSPQILTSPGYPDNYPLNIRCRWVIRTASNDTQESVHLNFLDFDVLSDTNCRQDRVTISDLYRQDQGSVHEFNSTILHSSNSNYFNSFSNSYQMQSKDTCGQSIPSDFYSMTPSVQIDFISNHEGTSKGFKLEYSILGCNRTYDKPYGLIISPNFPNYIQPGKFCEFNITTTPGKTISVYFRIFALPSSQNCTRSYLRVFDGTDPNSPLLANNCGHYVHSSIHSSGPSLRFKTANTQYSARGYDMTYVTTDQGSGCGGEVMESRGVVTSPNYPNDYQHEMDCTWKLSVPPGNRIKLRLYLTFGRDLSCADNYLEVYDRDIVSNTRHLVTKYCGGDNPSDHEGPFNSLDLHYVSSANNTGGWQATFINAIH